MADVVVAQPPAATNGASLLGEPRPDSPQSSHSSMKRKRDPSSSDSAEPTVDDDGSKPSPAATQPDRDQKALIQDYYQVLKTFDTTPSILHRPITDQSLSDEPLPKRQKSDDGEKLSTIDSRVVKGVYNSLEELVADLKKAVEAQIAELKLQEDKPGANSNVTVIAKLAKFKDRAVETFQREMSYPLSATQAASSISDGSQMHTDDNLVLTVFGNAPQAKHLFSSMPRSTALDKGSRQLQEIPLPNGLSSTRIIPSATPKPARIPTLGELFPSPRNLPPLQPSKAAKVNAKGNVLTFYHPELTEKSKYRAGSYFSQNISTGQWLDYSNATPSSQIKTKQRERAQSLAGVKPSTTELEMSEVEALFRGAFSSFAPAKDDSAAIVPAAQLGRMWWHRVGQRTFQKMVDAGTPEETVEGNVEELPDADEIEVDEEAVQKALDEWDDSLVDPSLEDAGGKSVDDKDVDELLQEVSDLIETLTSYQRNRNLTLPTSQDRHSMEPVNDLLRHGQLAQQPTEEEMLTYQALKTQLCLIVSTLPPYAAARINSDKLAELNVSTKVEVRTDEHRGSMEGDEPVNRARPQAPAVHQASVPRPPQRTPSVSAPSPYGGHYGPGQPYGTPSRPPMPNGPQYYGGRPQAPPMHARPPVPHSPMAQHTPPRPQPPAPYRPNGFPGYPQQQPGKPPVPYPQGNNVPYQGTPNQPRMQQPSFQHLQPGTPQYPRFAPNFPSGQPHHGQPGMSPQPPQQPHHSQTPQGYPQTNGGPHMAPRPMPGQHHPGQPYPGQPHPYAMSPQQQQAMQLQQQQQHQQQQHQQQQHAAQHQHQHSRPSPVNHPQQLMPGSPQHPYPNTPQGYNQNQKLYGYRTSLDVASQQQIIDRVQQEHRSTSQHLARSNAQDMTRNFTGQLSANAGSPAHSGSIGQNAGLSSLGLGSPNMDMSKLAAHRASMSASSMGQMSPSPKPHLLVPNTPSPVMNGMQQQQAMQPPPPSQSISPAQGGPFNQPPPQ